MTERTITRADLGEAVYQEVGLSRNESAELVEMVLTEVSDALVRGETVKISSFGTFTSRQKGERVGRNPKTGTRVEVPSKRIPYFKPSKELKDLVNQAETKEQAGSASVQPVSGTSATPVID